MEKCRIRMFQFGCDIRSDKVCLLPLFTYPGILFVRFFIFIFIFCWFGSCFISSADLVEVCRFTFQTMNKSEENITDTYIFLQRRSPHETKEIKNKSRKCYRQSSEIQMVTIILYKVFFSFIFLVRMLRVQEH